MYARCFFGEKEMLDTDTLYSALEACGDACAKACDESDMDRAIDQADAVRAIAHLLKQRRAEVSLPSWLLEDVT